MVESRRLAAPQTHSVLYPRGVVARAHTEICFGENQIFACLISLLLLSTAHPTGLQPGRVRTSTGCYSRFALAMDSSHAFGSATCYRVARLTLAFTAAPPLRGLTKQHAATRRLINQKARRRTSQPSALAGGRGLSALPCGQAVSPRTGANGASTACRCAVSGSISPSPSRLAFHLSLALLLRYRSPRST